MNQPATGPSPQATRQIPSIDPVDAARAFAAVGSKPRLDVLMALVRAGTAGLATGELIERLDMPASTLAHHLRFLSQAGVIVQRKRGRVVTNRADFTRIRALAGYLLRECCSDSGETC